MNFDTFLEIDLKKLASNTIALCNSYSDYKVKFADLKNNAYGMGFEIVNTLVNNGINYLFVGSLKDALEIRKINTTIPIVVNYPVEGEQIYDCINNNIAIIIDSVNYLKHIKELKTKDKLKVHILLDNGSNKVGISSKDEFKKIINLIKEMEFIEFEGIYSNITSLGVNDDFYYEQMCNINDIMSGLNNKDIIVYFNEPIMYHSKKEKINGIKFDLSLIGIEENIDDSFFTKMHIKRIEKKYMDLEFPNVDLELIFSVTSEISQIKKVKKNSLIGRNYIAKQDGFVGIVPVGHKDGITKAFNFVGINGIKRQILTDEIDYIVVDVDESNAPYDKVYIINEDRQIYELLDLLKTNRYYLMSVLNSKISRKYVNNIDNSTKNYL